MKTVRILLAAAAIVLWGASAVAAADLTGSWKGRLTAGDGSSSDVEIDFSPQGYPLYVYTNNSGLTRQVELSATGQTVEWVPQGGGVQRLVVTRIDKGPGRLSIGLAGSFEKAGGGYMDQQQHAALIEYALVPGGLQMRVTMESTAHFGDKHGMVGGDPNATVAEGLLQKVTR